MKLYEYEGRKIRECRMQLGLSGVLVSKQTGFSQSSVSAWETGRCRVPEEKRAKLCQVLNTTWEYISMGEQPEEPEELETYAVSSNLTPQPLATEFAFQCGQTMALIAVLADQWRVNPHLLDGLNPACRDKLETIFEAVTL